MFAKIFSQIFDSSIASDYMVRHVFMDLLVLADRDGVVDMTLDAISRRTNIPVDIVSRAIQKLMCEDRNSRSPHEDGRRIIPIDSHRDWGWQIVNYQYYRDIRDEESRRAYFRDKQREYREKIKSGACQTSSNTVKDSQTLSNDVKNCQALSKKITQADTDTDTEVDVEANTEKHSPKRRKRRSEGPTKTQIAKSRHEQFKTIILEYWNSKNPNDPMPWDGREGKNLEMFLKATPQLSAERFREYLRNRYRSDVNHGERPSVWIGSVTRFANGPIDKFGHPKNGGSENRTIYVGEE